MADLGLNEHHQSLVMEYLRFARYQRAQNLKAIEYSFKDVIDSRLLEDTYTTEEVNDMLTGLLDVVRAEVETELISSTHTNILLLRQLFAQAEKWHLRLQADLSELQNSEELANIKRLEEIEILGIKSEKSTSSPAKVRLPPMGETTGSIDLLNREIERLKEDNVKLSKIFVNIEEKNKSFLHEVDKLKQGLQLLEEENIKLKEIARHASQPSQLNEVEDQLNEVRSMLATKLELSVSSQEQLEMELSATRENVLRVQSQLQLAEQELERKFSQTGAYANMKQILSKKNEQIKELRKRLHAYEPEDNLEA